MITMQFVPTPVTVTVVGMNMAASPANRMTNLRLIRRAIAPCAATSANLLRLRALKSPLLSANTSRHSSPN